MPEASRKVRIAVDAMGGDHAPGEIVKGAILGAEKNDVEILLVGPTDVLRGELAKYNSSNHLPVRCVEANEIITESEPPALAVRRKPNCSIAVAAKLVRSGEADALISAGPSGAVAVSVIQFIGMVRGMERPTVGGTLGSFAPDIVIMDLGANVDCKPHHLFTFAIAGSVYAKRLLNISNPTVALLSTGVEEGKGNEVVREAYRMLKDSGLNFIGNIEGNDVLSGRANVIVCDGFVGNVVLKFYESMGDHALNYVNRKVKKYPPLRGIARFLFNRLFPVTKIAYEGEEAGGGILWGVDGIVRLSHGDSQAPQIVHGIESVKRAAQADIVGCLSSEIAKLRKEGKL